MRKFCFGLALLPAIMLAGCSGGEGAGNRLPTNAVTGKVTLGGAPVADASVSFSPQTPDMPAAFGRTDSQGVYTLTTYSSSDGAVKGSYKVMVSKSAPDEAASDGAPSHDPTGQGGSTMPSQHSTRGGGKAGGGSLLPDKYSSASTTPLIKEVTDGDNVINLEL